MNLVIPSSKANAILCSVLVDIFMPSLKIRVSEKSNAVWELDHVHIDDVVDEVIAQNDALLLKQRLTSGEIQGSEGGTEVVIGGFVAVVVVSPVEVDIYFIFAALQDFHVGDVVASAWIRQGRCGGTLRADTEDTVFQARAGGVVNQGNFRRGIFGEFAVIIPRWHPVLSVFGEAFNPLFELSLIEQTCLIVEEVFDFRTGNFLGHKCLRHGDLSLYRRLGQISDGD